jgi:competence ComEA-like helix-hairpin-helix protein
MSLQGNFRRLFSSLLCLLILCCADAALAKKKPPAHPINLNSASATELQQVPGIGPSTASKILEMRKSYGAFKSVDDLLAIKGIGPKRLEKMRKYLTVGKAPQTKKPSTGAQAAPAQPKSPLAKTAAAKPPVKSNPPPEPPAKDDEEQ